MRRMILRFLARWNRPVTVDYEPLPLEEQQARAGAWIAESERLRLTLDESLTPAPPPVPISTIQDQLTALGNLLWPDWQPPVPAEMPVAVQEFVRQEAASAAAEPLWGDLDPVIISFSDLPLMPVLPSQEVGYITWRAACCEIIQETLRQDAIAARRLAATSHVIITLIMRLPLHLMQQTAIQDVIATDLFSLLGDTHAVIVRGAVSPILLEPGDSARWSAYVWDEDVMERAVA